LIHEKSEQNRDTPIQFQVNEQQHDRERKNVVQSIQLIATTINLSRKERSVLNPDMKAKTANSSRLETLQWREYANAS